MNVDNAKRMVAQKWDAYLKHEWFLLSHRLEVGDHDECAKCRFINMLRDMNVNHTESIVSRYAVDYGVVLDPETAWREIYLDA